MTEYGITKLSDGNKKLLAFWNKALPGTTLGTSLIFLAESNLISKIYGLDVMDIAIDARAHNIKNILEGEFRVLHSSDTRDAALSVFESLEKVNKIFLCGGHQGFKNLAREMDGSHLIWPKEGRVGYDTTIIVQELFKQVGVFEPLQFRPELIQWAKDALGDVSEGKPIVGLHLKSSFDNASVGEISLADQDAWYEFISKIAPKSNVKFILLGDDIIKNKIYNLPNVIQANKLGANNFAKHLALLSLCQGFMGMMSSLCNLVLFSEIPYTIFKNPGHHKDEMMAEIGLRDQYSFATEHQKIFRINETVEVLLKSFSSMPLAIKKHR